MRSNYPDYLDGFSCKRGDCRRTCCRHDWNVFMSEDEYRANTDEHLDPELLDLAAAYMRINPTPSGNKDYAYVEMVGDVNCPYLDENGLCVWRARAGRHIGSTCINFPNTTMAYRDEEYLMPSGGCEAVLEPLLHRSDPVQMLHKDVEDPSCSYYVTVTDELIRQRPLLGYYPQLLAFGLDILQNRSYVLDERVAYLLEGLARIGEFEETGELEKLPAFLETFPHEISGHGVPIRQAGEEAPGAWLVVFVCGEIFSHYCHDSAHVPTALRIADGLGIAMREVRDEDGTLRCAPSLRSSETYPMHRAAFETFFEQRAVFLEHVAVSLYLKLLIPIREPNVWVHAQYFAATYAAVKGGLVGYFAPAMPSDEQLTDILVEIIRMATHSELMYPTICRAIRAAKLDSLQAMQMMVRA